MHYNSGAKIPISSCLLFLNDAIYLDACPFGTFATKMATYGHIFLQNTGRGNVTSHDITVMINAGTPQKETSLTDKRREQIS